MRAIEQLSDAEMKILKDLSDKTRFIFENLAESYVAMAKPHMNWTEEIKIAHFIKWCRYAENWGRRLLPTQSDEIGSFLQSAHTQEKEQSLGYVEEFLTNA